MEERITEEEKAAKRGKPVPASEREKLVKLPFSFDDGEFLFLSIWKLQWIYLF